VYTVENMTEYIKIKDQSRQHDNLMEYKLTANLMVHVWFQVQVSSMYSFVLPTVLRNHLFVTTIMTEDTTRMKPLKKN